MLFLPATKTNTKKKGTTNERSAESFFSALSPHIALVYGRVKCTGMGLDHSLVQLYGLLNHQ